MMDNDIAQPKRGSDVEAGIYLRLSEAKDEDEASEAAYERYEQHSRALCERRN